MKFDLFASLARTRINGALLSEAEVFQGFLRQAELADSVGFEVVWTAEAHFSSEIQKRNQNPVIPDFQGEVGLNTDFLLLAPEVFRRTRRIHVGSAIRNILCNGGPLAHAEAVKSFLALHQHTPYSDRRLMLGVGSGRFAYNTLPYGFGPRNVRESVLWPELKGQSFRQALEIFMRGLSSESFSSADLPALTLKLSDFSEKRRSDPDVLASFRDGDKIEFPSFWNFEELAVLPFDYDASALQVVLGSHDPEVYRIGNRYRPCWAAQLSITPPEQIARAHALMEEIYHPAGGGWRRDYLPQTVMVFVNADAVTPDVQRARAREHAERVLSVYWKAMAGTVSAERIASAVDNALCGNPEDVVQQVVQRFHPEDRVLLWFDFFCNDTDRILEWIHVFSDEVIDRLPPAYQT